MFFKTILLLFIVALPLHSCLYRSTEVKRNYHEMDELLRCIRISNDFYMDRCEITLFDWREYMWWTGRVFGEDSPEYQACQPDGESLRELYEIYDFEQHYISDMPNYPMVGVSQEQAEAYSNWRSDRVFEYILISRKILDWNPESDVETHFTIERYFNGEYQDKIPSPDALYYPVFSLPDQAQFEAAVHYADSVKCRDTGQRWRNCFPGRHNAYPRSHRDLSGWNWPYDTRPVDFEASRKTKKCLFHLVGNVAEWSSEREITMGGSWHHHRDSIGVIHMDSANAWTGFRNVMTWKKRDDIDLPKILHNRIKNW